MKLIFSFFNVTEKCRSFFGNAHLIMRQYFHTIGLECNQKRGIFQVENGVIFKIFILDDVDAFQIKEKNAPF